MDTKYYFLSFKQRKGVTDTIHFTSVKLLEASKELEEESLKATLPTLNKELWLKSIVLP